MHIVLAACIEIALALQASPPNYLYSHRINTPLSIFRLTIPALCQSQSNTYPIYRIVQKLFHTQYSGERLPAAAAATTSVLDALQVAQLIELFAHWRQNSCPQSSFTLCFLRLLQDGHWKHFLQLSRRLLCSQKALPFLHCGHIPRALSCLHSPLPLPHSRHRLNCVLCMHLAR
jgi:hypothetical protein